MGVCARVCVVLVWGGEARAIVERRGLCKLIGMNAVDCQASAWWVMCPGGGACHLTPTPHTQYYCHTPPPAGPHLGEVHEPVKVDGHLDAAVQRISAQVIRLVYVDGVAAIGHNVKQEALRVCGVWCSTTRRSTSSSTTNRSQGEPVTECALPVGIKSPKFEHFGPHAVTTLHCVCVRENHRPSNFGHHNLRVDPMPHQHWHP